MAERKEAKDRREEILDTTVSVLAFEGYASVTMRSIADRIGIHLSTLQYYFPTKRDLLIGTIDKCIGQDLRRQEQFVLDKNTEPKKLLRKVVAIHLEASFDPLVAKLFAGLWGVATHDHEVEAVLNEFYQRDCQRYASLIQRANPKLSKRTCENRAILLLAQLEGLVLFLSPGKLMAAKVKAIKKELLTLIDTAICEA